MVYIRLVAGCIQDGEMSLNSAIVGRNIKCEMRAANLISLAFSSFLICQIQGPRKVPSLSASLLGIFLVFLEGSLVDLTSGKQNRTAQRRFPGINMANEDNVNMLLLRTINLF